MYYLLWNCFLGFETTWPSVHLVHNIFLEVALILNDRLSDLRVQRDLPSFLAYISNYIQIWPMPETMTENLLALADFISSFQPYLAAIFSNSWG